jgi:hypothetical protein
MNPTLSSFQKTAQRSAAVCLEPGIRHSGVPSRLFRYATRAFGMTVGKLGYCL